MRIAVWINLALHTRSLIIYYYCFNNTKMKFVFLKKILIGPFHFSIFPAQEHLIASSEALDSAQRGFPLNTVVQALAEAADVIG